MNKTKALAFANKAAMLFVKKHRDEEEYPSECSFGFCSEDMFVPCTNNACHAGLKRPHNYGARGKEIPEGAITYIADVIYPSESITDEVRIAFIDYIMHCPTYKGVLVEKIAKAAYKDGYLLARASVPANQLASCLFSLRMASERPQMIKSWYQYVQDGMDKDVAYVLCHSLEFKGEDAVVISPADHHIGLNILVMGKENVYNFVKGNLVGAKEEPYSESHNYHSVEGLCGMKGDFHKVVVKYLKDEMVDIKQDKERPYLFHKEPVKNLGGNGGRYKYAEKFKQVLLKFNKEVLEETL